MRKPISKENSVLWELTGVNSMKEFWGIQQIELLHCQQVVLHKVSQLSKSLAISGTLEKTTSFIALATLLLVGQVMAYESSYSFQKMNQLWQKRDQN
jgi:hypothetical protein